MTGPDLRLEVYPDADALAEGAAERILAAAQDAIDNRGRFRIVLAGGATPAQTYRRLAETLSDWLRWEIYFGDERCLPAGDPERNSTLAQRTLLAWEPVLAARIHRIPAELGPEEAALQYQRVVDAARPFDLVLLGLGEDGHTASLFPEHAHAPGQSVHPVREAPKPPPERVTLSAEALSDARAVLVLVAGAAKREALAAWRAGADLPIAHIRPAAGVDVLADAAALGEPPPD